MRACVCACDRYDSLSCLSLSGAAAALPVTVLRLSVRLPFRSQRKAPIPTERVDSTARCAGFSRPNDVGVDNDDGDRSRGDIGWCLGKMCRPEILSTVSGNDDDGDVNGNDSDSDCRFISVSADYATAENSCNQRLCLSVHLRVKRERAKENGVGSATLRALSESV